MNDQLAKSEWNTALLRDVIESLENGSRPKGGVGSIRSGVPSIGGEHINNAGGFDFLEIKFVPNAFYQTLSRGKLRPYDVLVVKDGATTGKTAIVPEDFPYEKAAVNEHVFIVRPKKEIVDPEFLFYFMYSPLGQSQIKRNFHGSAQGGINTTFIDNFWIPVPPIQSQKKMSAALRHAHQLKLKREQTNQMTHGILQAVFLQMFGNPSTNPEGWPKKKLNEVCRKITDGTHVTPKYTENGVPFLSVKNIRNGYVDFSATKFISEEEHRELTKRCKPQFGDILYTKVGTVGIAALVDTQKEFSIFVSVALLKPDSELVDPKFLTAILNSRYVMSQAHTRVKGIAVPDLHLVEIKDFDIIVPPMEKQRKFSQVVTRIEQLKVIQQESTEEINRLFHSLMHKVFKREPTLEGAREESRSYSVSEKGSPTLDSFVDGTDGER